MWNGCCLIPPFQYSQPTLFSKRKKDLNTPCNMWCTFIRSFRKKTDAHIVVKFILRLRSISITGIIPYSAARTLLGASVKEMTCRATENRWEFSETWTATQLLCVLTCAFCVAVHISATDFFPNSICWSVTLEPCVLAVSLLLIYFSFVFWRLAYTIATWRRGMSQNDLCDSTESFLLWCDTTYDFSWDVGNLYNHLSSTPAP